MSIANIIGVHSLIMRYTDGRTGSKRSMSIAFSYLIFQDMIEEFFSPSDILRHINPRHMHILDFVIAAPECKRGVGTNSLNIICDLTLYISEKILIKERISLARKHKVLPHHNATPVTFVIKCVTAVITAAPDTKNIHI